MFIFTEHVYPLSVYLIAAIVCALNCGIYCMLGLCQYQQIEHSSMPLKNSSRWPHMRRWVHWVGSRYTAEAKDQSERECGI